MNAKCQPNYFILRKIKTLLVTAPFFLYNDFCNSAFRQNFTYNRILKGDHFMSGSTFGKIFRITTWGESHGSGIGVVIDGCPSGISLNEEDIQIF